MKLIELLVKVLPGKGGWPYRATGCVQDNDGLACFFRNGKPKFISPCWSSEEYQNAFDWEGSASLTEKADDNTSAIISREQYESALAALTETAPQQVESLTWSGDGLPPVGCECEVKSEDFSDWVKIKVVYVHNGEIAAIVSALNPHLNDRLEKFSAGYNAAQFRPICTEAERRREAAIDAIQSAFLLIPHRDCIGEGIWEHIAEGKIPGIKLED